MCFCFRIHQQHIQTLISLSLCLSFLFSCLALSLVFVTVVCSKSRITEKELLLTNTHFFLSLSLHYRVLTHAHVSRSFHHCSSLSSLQSILWLQLVLGEYTCAYSFEKKDDFRSCASATITSDKRATDWVRRLRVEQNTRVWKVVGREEGDEEVRKKTERIDIRLSYCWICFLDRARVLQQKTGEKERERERARAIEKKRDRKSTMKFVNAYKRKRARRNPQIFVLFFACWPTDFVLLNLVSSMHMH